MIDENDARRELGEDGMEDAPVVIIRLVSFTFALDKH